MKRVSAFCLTLFAIFLVNLLMAQEPPPDLYRIASPGCDSRVEVRGAGNKSPVHAALFYADGALIEESDMDDGGVFTADLPPGVYEARIQTTSEDAGLYTISSHEMCAAPIDEGWQWLNEMLAQIPDGLGPEWSWIDAAYLASLEQAYGRQTVIDTVRGLNQVYQVTLVTLTPEPTAAPMTATHTPVADLPPEPTATVAPIDSVSPDPAATDEG